MNRAEYAAFFGILCLIPPLIMWVSLIVYFITDVNFFDQIYTSSIATKIVFSQFLIVVGYPVGIIALGMIAKTEHEEITHDWTKKTGKALIFLGSAFIILTLLAAMKP